MHRMTRFGSLAVAMAIGVAALTLLVGGLSTAADIGDVDLTVEQEWSQILLIGIDVRQVLALEPRSRCRGIIGIPMPVPDCSVEEFATSTARNVKIEPPLRELE